MSYFHIEDDNFLVIEEQLLIPRTSWLRIFTGCGPIRSRGRWQNLVVIPDI